MPELFPLTGEELSEDVFDILIGLFASPRQDSRGSEHRHDCRVPEDHVYSQDRDRAKPLGVVARRRKLDCAHLNFRTRV